MGKDVSFALLALTEGSTPFDTLLRFEPLFPLAIQLWLPLAVFRHLPLHLRLLVPQLPVPATTSSLRKTMVLIWMRPGATGSSEIVTSDGCRAMTIQNSFFLYSVSLWHLPFPLVPRMSAWQLKPVGMHLHVHSKKYGNSRTKRCVRTCNSTIF